MAEFPLQEVIDESNARIEWKPFELRPEPQQRLRPEGEYLQTTWENSVLPLAEKMDVEMHLPDVSPQPYTHLAHEGFQFAREQNLSHDYNWAVFGAFFQEGQDIGNIDVLTDIAATLGLDEKAFNQALNQRTYRDKHQEELEYARQNKIQAVPTFLVNGTRLQGLVSKNELRRAIDHA